MGGRSVSFLSNLPSPTESDRVMQEVDTWNDLQAGQLRDPAGRGPGVS